MGEFVRVGSASELADGDLAAYEVDGRYVAVARVGDAYRAFDDVCTHRGCSLSEGELDGSVVVCPCHAGEYDVHTGEVLGGPPPEPVRTYVVRVTGDDLEIEA
jgi:nitrite reductase/ring-hydroxylating ferredoxin subunit